MPCLSIWVFRLLCVIYFIKDQIKTNRGKITGFTGSLILKYNFSILDFNISWNLTFKPHQSNWHLKFPSPTNVYFNVWCKWQAWGKTQRRGRYPSEPKIYYSEDGLSRKKQMGVSVQFFKGKKFIPPKKMDCNMWLKSNLGHGRMMN